MALKNKKEENFSEWYTEIVGETGADLADIRYGIQGAIVNKPWATMIIRKFEELIEKEVEKDGHKPMLFPTIVPEKYIKAEKDHVEGFTPELYWVTKGGSDNLEEPMYLRPTGESQIYPMYALWLRSHKDLPYKLYQSRISVFRYEPTTRPYLRGREFNFFECHDVFTTHEEVLEQIKKDMEYSENVTHKQLGIPFLFVKRPQWDKFAGAVDTFAADSLVPDGKVNTVASTHDLGQNFSKTYNIQFTDKNEKKQFAWQTCYGPGLIRIMAGLIAVHGDNNGLVLPFKMAPIQVVIVPIFGKDNNKLLANVEEIKEYLEKMDLRVETDLDKDDSPGFKFNKWEMLGVPVRIEIGQKELEENKFSLKSRIGTKKQSELKDLHKTILALGAELFDVIKTKADDYLKENTRIGNNLEEINHVLKEHGGFVKSPWCSINKDGEKCADILQKETFGGKVRGTLYNKDEKPDKDAVCVICKKPAKHTVYIAKSY